MKPTKHNHDASGTEHSLGLPLSVRTATFLDASRKRVEGDIPSVTFATWSEAFLDRFRHLPLRRRQAKAIAWTIANAPVYLFEDALLVGQWYSEGTADLYGERADPRWKEFSAYHYAYQRIENEIPEAVPLRVGTAHDGAWVGNFDRSTPGHIAWHWDWILKDGISGLIERVTASRQNAVSDDERDTLDGMRDALEGVLEWNDRHIEALEKKLAGSAFDHETKRLLGICRQVPRYGARTFHEAVQAFHFTYLATIMENSHGGNSPGRLDYYLWPYLERDLAQGNCSLAKARELVDELFIRFHERYRFGADGSVDTIVVGGSHPDGTVSVNPLSHIMIESIAGLKISHPSVYIRMPENAPESFVELAALDLTQGGNRAQIISDNAVIKAMVDGGVAEHDARMYMCGGCMELSPHGMNSDLLFTGFVNIAKVLELTINGGLCMNTGFRMLPESYTKTLSDYRSFEELFNAVHENLKFILGLSFRCIEINHEGFVKFRPRFLVSSQIDDCIARRKLIHEGGARYEDWGQTPLGIPNLGDSLHALKVAVYDEKYVTSDNMLEALRTDFHNNELLRQRLLAIPKYGQGHAEADKMAQLAAKTACDIYHAYRNPCGGRIKPMIMTFMMAPIAGMALAATPDGRHAKTSIAQGLTPQACGMRNGITTGIRSANTMPLHLFWGGASTMWDLDPNFASIDNVKSLLMAYFATGGQMFQGNMTDVRQLESALVSPEEYQHMLVRVGGYSGRFVALDKTIQHDVIHRYRHSTV